MFASAHASITNYFNRERTLTSHENYKTALAAALTEWRGLFEPDAQVSQQN